MSTSCRPAGCFRTFSERRAIVRAHQGNRYAVPGPVGGKLIRRVIRTFKEGGVSFPLEGPILIGVSGGVDSISLAHLLARYGRKLVAPGQLTFLHIDHGWRPESAKEERDAVRDLARALGVGFLAKDLAPPNGTGRQSRNLEEDARLKRQRVYRELAGSGKPFTWVLTAHHRDDQAETVLFRILRGQFLELGEGILFHDDGCLRPFLHVSKEEIRSYAREEGLVFFEDPTNQDPARFRSWARNRVFPMLEEGFPATREILARYPERWKESQRSALLSGVQAAAEIATGRPLGRAHIDALRRQLLEGGERKGLTLPGGVRLKPHRKGYLIEKIDSTD